MPYVREKKIPGKDGKVYSYYQLVEGKRVDGKVRQRVIAHLGKHDSIEEARVAAASVVPKESQPAEDEALVETVDAALLRKLRTQLRARARRRARKAEDILEAANHQYDTLADADWRKLEELHREAEELTHDAVKVTEELSRRKHKSGMDVSEDRRPHKGESRWHTPERVMRGLSSSQRLRDEGGE